MTQEQYIKNLTPPAGPIDVVLDTDAYNEILVSFANNISTTEGGTHETGFKSALTKVLVEYGKKYKLIFIILG